jgi:hypothetical protein
MWRVVFEAAIFRRIMRGCDDDAVGLVSACPVVYENGSRDSRCRSEAVGLLNNSRNPLAANTSSAVF